MPAKMMRAKWRQATTTITINTGRKSPTSGDFCLSTDSFEFEAYFRYDEMVMHRQRIFVISAAALLIAGSFVFFQLQASAVTRTWDGGGTDGTCGGAAGDGNKWSCAANWSGDTVPGASDIAVFDATSTKDATIDATFAGSLAGMQINAGYTGVITQARTLTVGSSNFSQAAGTFTGATQAITVNGTFTLSSGVFNATTGTMTLASTVTLSGGTFTPLTGTVTLSGGISPVLDVNSTQEFYNLTFGIPAAGNRAIGSGDTLTIDNDLVLSTTVNNGTINALGNITQNSTANGGSVIVNFAAVGAQTYTINGGTGPVVRLDSSDDASDSIIFAAAGGLNGLTVTAGFSGTIPFSNASDFGMTVITWNQAAGTFSGGSFSNLSVNSLTVSGGTFTAPTTVTTINTSPSFTVANNQSFTNLSIATAAGLWNNANSNTLVVTGTLTTNAGMNNGTVSAQGNVVQNSSANGGSTIVDFAAVGAQTYTINGGTGPTLRLDSSDDASDSIVFAAAGGLNNLTVTSGFVGTIPISNASNFTMTVNTWSQAAGTFSGSSFSNLVVNILTVSGGTFTAPTTLTTTGTNPSFNVPNNQTFNNLTINTAAGVWSNAASNTIITTGTLTLNTTVNNGVISTQGNTVQNSGASGGSTIVDFGIAASQTYTINGGTGPTVRLDAAEDASDAINFAAAGTLNGLTISATFSGTVPITNASNFAMTVNTWTQAAGTFNGASFSTLNLQTLTITGGTFNATTTVVSFGGFTTWDVVTSQTFNNLTINHTSSNPMTIASGDTLVTTGTLTFTDGITNGGTFDARGNITQGSNFDGGSTIVDFGDNAVAQTFTLNGGTTDVIRLDAAGDASDSIVLAAATTITELRVTSGFSGAIPFSNSGNFTPTFTLWNQAAGTYDASAQTAWNILNLTITGGTFTAPITTNSSGGFTTYDVNVSQTFNNLTINHAAFNTFTIASGDSLVATGTLTLTQGNVNTGTLEARGNVTVASTFNGGNATLLFSGSGTQTFTLTGATGNYNGDVLVNKSGGQVSLASALVLDAASQDLDIQEGTFNTAGNNVTVNGTSGTLVVEDGGTLKLFGAETFTLNASQPTLQSGSTVMYTGDGDSASDTYTVTTLKAAYHHLTINSTDGATDTFQLGAAIDLNGNFRNTAGTFDVSAGNRQMNVAGNWTNTGTFNARAGTVILDGTNQTVDDTTFFNFTHIASDDTLTFASGETQTFTGTFDIEGTLGHSLHLRSSVDGSYAFIDPQGSRTTQYLDVKDSNNVNATTINCPTCSDSGHNVNWTFAPGFNVSSISGNTTEAGGTATFSVVLAAPPTADVTFPLSSNDTTEGTIAISTMTFTTGNWNTPQTVTVTGVDDTLDDGDIPYTIVLGAATSADAGYNGLDPSDVAVTNTDNDTSGFTVSTISGNTTEAGGTATFTVVLTAQPTADVTIGKSSNDTTEGTVTAPSLVFTSGNWDTPQTVTVTGVDDFLDDGDVGYQIILAAATSSDTNYNGLNPNDVSVTNTDNDTSGFNPSAISGHTTEDGGTATFTVVLTAQPTADVTIGVSTGDATEGTPSPASLTFTAGNWNNAGMHTVTVTGVDDVIVDGNVTYSIVLGVATSADTNYNGLDPSDVSVINDDNDVANITASTISGNTTEDLGTATFTVVLASQPTADVTIGVSSGDTTEGTVAISSLTFTSGNWDTPQTVTVTGVDDAVDDGDIAYTIVLAAAVSDDTNYNGVNAADVDVTNTDNDTAGFTVSGITGHTSETGMTQTFTIVLDSQPTADVTIPVSSSDTTEGTVTFSSFTFTSSNWNSPQTEFVHGVDDVIVDGDVGYTIVLDPAISTDPLYNNLDPDDVAVVNDDDDVAGFVISGISGNTSEDGDSAAFTIKLKTQPTDDVVIGVSSSDTTEGTVDTSSLTFTSVTWNDPQTVTVTGVDDFIVDGNVSYSVVLDPATSTDGNYNGLDPNNVSLFNLDNDAAHVSVSGASADTTEAGGTATFTVVLDTQPTDDVVIAVSSSDTSEGTVSTSSLTFTNADWDTPQTVTLTGVDDTLNDGDILYHAILSPAVSNDTDYDGLNPDDVFLRNIDDDNSEFVVSPISGDTTEGGGTATFTVHLAAQPTADVTTAVSSSDTTEGTPDVSSLTFTDVDWGVDQTVTVTGVDDALSDGDIDYTIVLDPATSADTTYDGVDPPDVSVTNIDDDTPGFNVSTISGATTETGVSKTFTVSLASQPSADVTIPVSSSDTSEGTPDTSLLTFTGADWDMEQTVTVTGVDDFLDDGDIMYTIVLGAASSADSAYNGLNPDDVSVTNLDNDASGFAFSAISGDTTEAGGTATFTMELTAQPTADVSIDLSSSDTSEGTVDPTTITFTATDWNTPKTVTATGVDDVIDDGDVAYTIVLDPATSADLNYEGLDPNNMSVTNDDDDTAGVTITESSGSTDVDETGPTSDTYDIVLTSEPTADVTITISPDAQVTTDVSSLTFTAADWFTPQTVTVTAVDDAVDETSPHTGTITHSASSADGLYDGMPVASVFVNVTDNDTSLISVSAISGDTTEAGGTATFTVVLESEPSDEVTIGVSTDDASEGTPDTALLTFLPGNWDAPQTVTVTGQDDDIDDGDVLYHIVLGAASSLDPAYDGLDPSDVDVINDDDDTAGITITESGGSTDVDETGPTSDTYDVVLMSEPTDDVTITVSPDAQVTTDQSSLTFTNINWDIPQTVTVTAVDDAIDESATHTGVITHTAASADPGYDGMIVDEVVANVTDNDTAGVTITESGGSTDVTEGGTTDSYEVVLDTQPTDDVVVTVSPDSQVDVDQTTLTFTAFDWDTPQLVTVNAVDDSSDEATVHSGVITHSASSSDANYDGIAIAHVVANVTDNDTSGGGGSGGGGGSVSHLAPSNTSVSVNADAACTADANVTLTLRASNADSFIVSNDPDMNADSYQTYNGGDPTSVGSDGYTVYTMTLAWTLSDPTTAGQRTVYVQYRSVYGNVSSVVTDSIDLQPTGCEAVPPPVVTPPPIPCPVPAPTPTYTADQFIRTLDSPTLYFKDALGILHPFPTLASYLSYVDSCTLFTYVADDVVANASLGAPMMPAPDRVLLKFANSPKVYAVDTNPGPGLVTLRWVVDESVAVAVYGADWETYLIDVDDYPPSYVLGSNITGPEPDIDPTLLKSRAALTGAVSYNLYIVNPDGTVRQGFSSWARITDNANGTTTFNFEDKGTDFDYNDVVIEVDPRTCESLSFTAHPLEALWHHQIGIQIFYEGSERGNFILWPDSHTAVNEEKTVHVTYVPDFQTTIETRYVGSVIASAARMWGPFQEAMAKAGLKGF